MRAGPYQYPRTLREDVRRTLTHPIIGPLAAFWALVGAGLWAGGWLG